MPKRDSSAITSPFTFVTLYKHGSPSRTEILAVIGKTLTVSPGAKHSVQGDSTAMEITVTHTYNTLSRPLSFLFILKNTHTYSRSSEHQPSQMFWFNPRCPKQCQCHKTSTDADKLPSFKNRVEIKVNG